MNLPALLKPVQGAVFAIVLLAGCAGNTGDNAGDGVADPSWETARQTTMVAEIKKARPEFSLPTLAGDTLSSSDLDNKVVLVNFWATWCGPCVIETPELVALHDEWKDRPFEIVGISMDEEGFEIVAPFADDFQISYPIILDDGDLADEFGGVYALPTTFIVDAAGQIRHRFIGIFPIEDMREELEKLLDQAN
ncbi:MAG: TlpA family protein disulfide reductase [Bacteroidetes bacterium]|nr:TlpA family protein disulfide reductase [Bacteroidota bacterium]